MRFLVIYLITSAVLSSTAQAAGLPLDPSQFPDPNSLISPALANAVTKTVGLGTDHRSYESATPLGNMIGLDLGFSVTIAHVPPDFGKALEAAGLSGVSASSIPPL